ncbi:hypothetical protein HS1genome_2020 [Sulfodiicoccus acidiphilus]|uniref:DUF488 domain-containing protein n=2 Tax=Sulfodiicoccus acidiphilus TaxID=1670455 RepID=A0A348B629_9CREN|nr:hypothetical protein HS1genome_2020 [Sulfodiicoccus acidiphilus]GGU02182.1 hypothetical protein GCM10007116_19150 [Sulfodiicoccus acidiphilus]
MLVSVKNFIMIKVKRIYDEPSPEDGLRVLVDRLWPRGVKKEVARVDVWLKEIAPSDELRKWFSHDPGRWEEFKVKYREELEGNPNLARLAQLVRENNAVTLLYSAKDRDRNNAVALREVLEGYLSRS